MKQLVASTEARAHAAFMVGEQRRNKMRIRFINFTSLLSGKPYVSRTDAEYGMVELDNDEYDEDELRQPNYQVTSVMENGVRRRVVKIIDEQHLGNNPLEGVALVMVTKFPIDPLHCVYFGVVRKVIRKLLPGNKGNRKALVDP